MSEVRTNVIRLGQPMMAAALHVFVAQIEAKRGLLSIAKRHTDIALSRLATSQNIWLEATVENTNACLSIMQSDFDAALAHANDDHCVWPKNPVRSAPAKVHWPTSEMSCSCSDDSKRPSTTTVEHGPR